MLLWLALAALATEEPFPERTPALMEACLVEAIATGSVTRTSEVYREELKYICGGEVAHRFWDFLETSKTESWEQDTENGVWSSRSFPLGGCFKRVRNIDGSVATSGISCTIWIPRRLAKE